MLSFLMKIKLPHLYDRIVSCYFLGLHHSDAACPKDEKSPVDF